MAFVFEGPAGRVEATAQFGARAMDRVNPHWQCDKCGARVRDPNFYSVGSIGEGLDALLENSRGQALGPVLMNVPRCCDAPARLIAADYHSFHSEKKQDLVLRWSESSSEPVQLWWDGASYRPAQLDEDEEEHLEGDLVIRRAATRMEVEGVDAAVKDIQAAWSEVPGDPAMIHFVRPLLDAGYVDLAREILEDYTDSYPDDADAAALLESIEDE